MLLKSGASAAFASVPLRPQHTVFACKQGEGGTFLCYSCVLGNSRVPDPNPIHVRQGPAPPVVVLVGRRGVAESPPRVRACVTWRGHGCRQAEPCPENHPTIGPWPFAVIKNGSHSVLLPGLSASVPARGIARPHGERDVSRQTAIFPCPLTAPGTSPSPPYIPPRTSPPS